ncbi:glycosyltransferase family 2 protein [Chloroflexota bacterium]
MKHNPLISIISPVLNGEKYIELSIKSVLEQTYTNIEQIFVDGGSSDRTLDILSDYQKRYPDKIRYITGTDKGVGSALNKGFEIAKGDVYGWLDSDDVYLPDAVEAIVRFFESDPEAYFVYGESDIVGESGEFLRNRPVKDFNWKEAVTSKHYIIICTAFYRREVVERVGGFNDLGNDLDFWLRAAKEFKLHRMDKLISHWREHTGNITMKLTAKNKKTNRQKFKEDYLICRQYRGSIFSPRAKKYFLFLVLDSLGLFYFVNNTLLPKVRNVPIAKNILKAIGI